MISDVQHEVAVHLLANALRKRRVRTAGSTAGDPAGQSVVRRSRRQPDEEYLRGMIDMLNALYGHAFTDELYREAVVLERFHSTR